MRFFLTILALSLSLAICKAQTSLNVTVDGRTEVVRWYKESYAKKPNRPQDQIINIYIPQNATKASPILFLINNSGWQANSYPENTIQDGKEYDGTNNKIGVALKRGYVIVSYGARGRSDGPTDGLFLGHSPATVTDTKAAIRYLRCNRNNLPAGDTERIIVTGISGGGALSALIAASGNNPDFFPYLHEIGAAGIIKNSDGSYSSEEGVGDNVFAAISYCPITDLGHADAAYEWLWQQTRKALYQEGKMHYSYVDDASVMKASEELAAIYTRYVDGLDLKDEHGTPLNSANLAAFIESLMMKEIESGIVKYGAEQMQLDIQKPIVPFGWNGPTDAPGIKHRRNNGWLTFHKDGSFSYDFNKHLYYTALYTELKAPPGFSSYGLYDCVMHEDTLFGEEDDEYCPFNPYSWNNDKLKNNVGKDDTGLTWEEFMNTDKGKKIKKQIKMTDAISYLTDNQSAVAPYWYVRHGMDDRDTSWALEATLFSAIFSSPQVIAHNLGFAWMQPHCGDYDVAEAYSWLSTVLDMADSNQ